MAARHGKTILAITAVGLAALAVKPFINPAPLLIWNASDSVSIGWYLVKHRQPDKGEIAVARPPDWVQLYASSRGYLPEKAWLLKPVFAVPRSAVCRFGSHVFVEGILVSRAKKLDRHSRVLPVWKGCRALKSDDVFLLAKPANSFDSRYFGPVKRDLIIGTAVRLRFSWSEFQ
jgi:type IV secretory pathway protease TraF